MRPTKCTEPGIMLDASDAEDVLLDQAAGLKRDDYIWRRSNLAAMRKTINVFVLPAIATSYLLMVDQVKLATGAH